MFTAPTKRQALRIFKFDNAEPRGAWAGYFTIPSTLAGLDKYSALITDRLIALKFIC